MHVTSVVFHIIWRFQHTAKLPTSRHYLIIDICTDMFRLEKTTTRPYLRKYNQAGSKDNILNRLTNNCSPAKWHNIDVTDNSLSNQNQLQQRFQAVQQRVHAAEGACGREPGSVELLAVSKTRSSEEIDALADQGQRHFGENYLQEALAKMSQLASRNLCWHFIGRIQSNKTRQIAENFDWVHSVASLKHATRLSQQRPDHLPPLNICLQVNTSGESSKDGHSPDEVVQMLPAYQNLEKIIVQGLMTIPAPVESSPDPRQSLQSLRTLRDRLSTLEHPLTTLSMGMSNDLEDAICEGATIVRIGTAIFGPRHYNPSFRG